jgi:hypothetical protein
MANPTTNYGWPMPTSTDLVTDLPADFAAFGQPVDTSLKALNPETTLGDIAYRSATANTNTRLAIGTTGQILAVSGGVPAWTTPAASASGMTFINRTTFSAQASVTIDSIFTSTYESYLIVIERVQGSTGSDDLQMQLRVGASTTTTNYFGTTVRNTTSGIFTNYANVAQFTLADNIGKANQPDQLNFIMTNVGNSSEIPTFSGTGVEGETPGGVILLGGTNMTNATYTGILLKPSAGTMTGEVTIYGLAKS